MTAPGTAHLALLRALVDRGASDLHCKAGSAPAFRVAGRLERGDGEVLSAEDVARVAQELLSIEDQEALLRQGSVVGAFVAEGVGRFRVAAFRQRGAASLVVHAVPNEIRPLETLGLPPVATAVTAADRGLVLVGSPVGNGATTTMASMVDHVIRTRACHVLTVDDPVEVVHHDDRSLVSQLEVGADVSSLADGVRAAARVDADVVAVSELSDRAVAVAVLEAVARGKLVFAAVGAGTAVEAVNAFLDRFSYEERLIHRSAFARALLGIVVQRLIPGRIGPVLVAEAMVVTPRIEQVVGDDARLAELPGLIEEGVFHGMQSLDQSLLAAVRSGHLDEEVALDEARNPEELRISLLRG